MPLKSLQVIDLILQSFTLGTGTSYVTLSESLRNISMLKNQFKKFGKLNGRVMKNNISLYFERTVTRMRSVEWWHLFAMILKDTEPHFKVTPMFDAE